MPRASDSREPSRIEAHQVIKWNRRPGSEYRIAQSFVATLERLGGYPQVIKAQIQQEPEAHQLEVADVFILVLVHGFEPPIVASDETPVVRFHQRLHWFASPLRPD